MTCYFCKTKEVQLYNDIGLCKYYICFNCWESIIPSYITQTKQKWKLIQMRGDKISETL
jgi:hypothetical protein